MEDLFLTVALASLTTSAVLLPLLLLSTRLQNRYAGRTLYVVWLVLALRLAIPVDLSLPQAAVKVEAPSYTVSLPAREDRTIPIQVFAPLENGADSQPLTPAVSPDTAAAAVSLTELAAASFREGKTLSLGSWGKKHRKASTMPAARQTSIPKFVTLNSTTTASSGSTAKTP